ncbi:IclR family transcriptional regulator [Sphingobium nicotianae]|uniref:IclR family transcriptional regulator n=1 Tax=Sphingobium nicotianae TaxID=2782607 RepID=A0A9X1DCG9_9SPHN|nr:IclR family transcriptional regulator [Sphingobium nicotianae]MBT2187325.1 IclR family transcriptional regulator [Sphingobium nicotianae]
MAEQSRRRVQSIEVGFRVLRVLRMAEGPLPLREIAARASMPPSKVHLYLVSFVRENMAYQEPSNGYYGLGSFAIQLGLAAVRQLDVVSLAADVLTQLRDQTDCAIYLSLWGDQGPCIVAKADGGRQGAFALRLGYILPLGTTASGLIYLAHMPRSETQALLDAQTSVRRANGGRLPLAMDQLDGPIEAVRANGYASTVGQLNQNFAAVAAPVLGPQGNLAAVLTLLGPIEYVTANRDKCVGLVPAAAQSVSRQLAEGAG